MGIKRMRVRTMMTTIAESTIIVNIVALTRLKETASLYTYSTNLAQTQMNYLLLERRLELATAQQRPLVNMALVKRWKA